MFVPSHALAGFESFFQLILGLNGTERHLKSAGQGTRELLSSASANGLLLTQIKFSVGRIVNLRNRPRAWLHSHFSHVALSGIGTLRKALLRF